jgi:hypothetical protein
MSIIIKNPNQTTKTKFFIALNMEFPLPVHFRLQNPPNQIDNPPRHQAGQHSDRL